MEWSILFMGPVGAGKTEAIRSLSDIEVLDTDVQATDETALLKDTTTVSMDVGVLNLGGGDKLRLYGAPGQGRFDFMWEILVEQAKGLVIVLNHASADPLADFNYYISALEKILIHRKIPLVLGITHVDEQPNRPIHMYMDYLNQTRISFAQGLIPVLSIDARLKQDANVLMMALASMLEVNDRLDGGYHYA